MSENIINQNDTTEPAERAQKVEKTSAIYNASLLFVIILVSGSLLYFWSTLQAPKNFLSGSVVVFDKGDTVTSLAQKLKVSGYIKSEFLFKFYIKLSGQGGKIPSGGYYFEAPLSTPAIAHRFAVGDTNQKQIRLTIPEGNTVRQVAEIVNAKIPNISKESFLEIASKDEGFIFPDTYFFYGTASAEDVYNKMRSTFDRKTSALFEQYKINSEEEKRDVVIMASLLEEEGVSSVDRKIISGILKKRLDMGMALQVDATINYIKGKPGKVYIKDTLLKSPYNTYTNKGLPPGPIASPGLESLEAALNPTETKYLYYLTGDDGVFYYARTYQEHKRNKAKYIK